MRTEEVEVFNSTEFGQLRTVERDGEFWFVGKDVALALGYSNPRDALAKRVDDEDKGVAICDTLGGVQDLTIINESGLYSLVMSSKLDSAKRFKRWVTNEVLPSIRKHGAYMTPETLQAAILNPDTVIQLCQQLKAEQAKSAQLVAENNALKPAADYAKQVCIGENCRTTTTLAKDYGMSAEKMNELLHELGIQYKTSDKQWVLYSKYCGKGYTKNRKGKPFKHSNGRVETPNTTVWTELGQRFIYDKLKAVGKLPSSEE